MEKAAGRFGIFEGLFDSGVRIATADAKADVAICLRAGQGAELPSRPSAKRFLIVSDERAVEPGRAGFQSGQLSPNDEILIRFGGNPRGSFDLIRDFPGLGRAGAE